MSALAEALTPVTVSGTWQPHTVKPTKPTCALIAVSLERDGSEPFAVGAFHEYDLKRQRWCDVITDEVLRDEIYMWLDHDALVPDDLLHRRSS